MVEDQHSHGTGKNYLAGCEGCKILNRAARAKTRSTPKEKIRDARYESNPKRVAWRNEWMREYRKDPEVLIKQNASAQRSQARRRDRLRERTVAEQDADFDRLHPEGTKACRACGLRLQKEEFARNRCVSSGRAQSCLPCAAKRVKRNFARKFEEVNTSRGVDVWTCVYCEISLDEESREHDHFIPVAAGGSDDFENLVPACFTCNRGVAGKFHSDPWEWLAARFPERIPTLRRVFPD